MFDHRLDSIHKQSTNIGNQTVEQTPSLKTQLGMMFKHLERDFNERMLHKHTRELIDMMASEKFKYTCAHSSWYECIDQDKTRLHYELHAASKCMDICTLLNVPIDGEFAKLILGLKLELFNLFFVKTKREKIRINKRIRKLSDKVHAYRIYNEGYKAGSFLHNLKREAIGLLTESVIASLK